MKSANLKFDAIVVGGGHAGAEAARALAMKSHKVALISLNQKNIGAMSCNPAIGGVAKGHIVFEIDALGGLMGRAADLSSIQARRLNENKGPAVRSTRVQCDKEVYANTVQEILQQYENITIIEAEASRILVGSSHGKNCVKGVALKDGSELFAQVVIITSGTFMGGLMFCGDERTVGGRFGDKASLGLSDSIKQDCGHSLKRLKTGTPARLNKNSINFSVLEKQWGDSSQRKFSWKNSQSRLPQLACYMTYTNEQTHEIIKNSFHRSPLFSGEISGVGPRYCPSVEDKVKRFSERNRHQIFLEPEGLNLDTIYPNGLSTSLPADVQMQFLRTIKGLESVELVRPGYAVEYDVVNPTELNSALMSKNVNGLYFAGQVNRTSGYEEAAAQGLWAAINASRSLQGIDNIELNRSRSYIETLVSDLTTIGTEEPYRMFTSRSEFRLHLREDNAKDRLFDLAVENSLVSPEQIARYSVLKEEIQRSEQELRSQKIRIDQNRVITLVEYLKRPEISWEKLLEANNISDVSDEAVEAIEIEAKYSGYLQKQERDIKTLNLYREKNLKIRINTENIPELSIELKEKINAMQPKNIEDLFSIQGMTPSAVLAIVRSHGSGSVSRETIA
jgi:tRNA uridine 5-carboxymethylaminomethyl modification enzyme